MRDFNSENTNEGGGFKDMILMADSSFCTEQSYSPILFIFYVKYFFISFHRAVICR